MDIYSKISGVQSGPDSEIRQEALEAIRELKEAGQRVYVDLVPQWENPYDGDAIAALVNLPEIGRTQIGFIKNSTTQCDFCHHTHARFPKAGCIQCGHTDQLRRDGIATRLSAEMRKDPDVRFYAEVSEVTGGRGKSFGLNIVIRRSK